MAKYTMLLAEYLERGGQLPASFSQIEGFKDLFIKYYCDKELGFETETLFKTKLELYADLYIASYAEKIRRKATAWLEFDAPIKVTYETDDTTFNAGATKGKTSELPFNAVSANPSVVNENDAYENNNNRVLKREESGKDDDQAIKALEFLNREVESLVLQLLDKFKNCFMGVY